MPTAESPGGRQSVPDDLVSLLHQREFDLSITISRDSVDAGNAKANTDAERNHLDGDAARVSTASGGERAECLRTFVSPRPLRPPFLRALGAQPYLFVLNLNLFHIC